MRLLRRRDVAAEPGELVYRHARIGHPAGLVLAAVVGAALVAFSLWVPWPTALFVPREAPAVGVVIVFVALLAASGVLRDLTSRDNWVLRVRPDRLLLNLRSHRNAHLPAEDPVVLSIPIGEIASVRRVALRWTGGQPRPGTHRRSWLELEFASVGREGLPDVREALRRERTPAPVWRVHHQHHAVAAVGDDRLAIRWHTASVELRAGLDEALRQLATVLDVAPDHEIAWELGAVTRDRLEDCVHDLLLADATLPARRLVQRVLGVRLREAGDVLDRCR